MPLDRRSLPPSSPAQAAPAEPARDLLWPGLLLLGIALYRVCFWVPGDDHWWHMLTGRLVLETGRVPAADPFSFTFQGDPWVNWEWPGSRLARDLARAVRRR